MDSYSMMIRRIYGFDFPMRPGDLHQITTARILILQNDMQARFGWQMTNPFSPFTKKPTIY